ncbi:hypothetical protein AG1IA_08589 [Rhizoctonia solani AG-1 IA]|uniref:Uncharacterized protein n=1 Tax=Thanatephorus cucumeris (strain AG1-IA) TaxID=983506 RepID=L8WGS9_THACA|nr:hypothetical protein AG1IA_08589 [Rhizoctonia solani AG-1 IA]
MVVRLVGRYRLDRHTWFPTLDTRLPELQKRDKPAFRLAVHFVHPRDSHIHFPRSKIVQKQSHTHNLQHEKRENKKETQQKTKRGPET